MLLMLRCNGVINSACLREADNYLARLYTKTAALEALQLLANQTITPVV